MLIDIISIDPRKLFQYIFLVLPPHLLLVVSLFHAPVYLPLDLLLHVWGHITVIFQFAHPVHVIFFLVQFERIEAMLFLLLVIDVCRGLFFLELLLGTLKLVVD